MERKLNILAPFLEDSNKSYSIRELSRLLNVNHTTVRQYLNSLVKEGFLSMKRSGVYTFFYLIPSRKSLNLKMYYNFEKLRESNLITDVEKAYDFPAVVLFGSYASATDDETSDIDICIISNVQREFSLEKYERILHRRVSLHRFTKKSWWKCTKKNPHLVNSICNGVTLSGQLEVV